MEDWLSLGTEGPVNHEISVGLNISRQVTRGTRSVSWCFTPSQTVLRQYYQTTGRSNEAELTWWAKFRKTEQVAAGDHQSQLVLRAKNWNNDCHDPSPSNGTNSWWIPNKMVITVILHLERAAEKEEKERKKKGTKWSRNPSISRGWTVFQPASATQKWTQLGHDIKAVV